MTLRFRLDGIQRIYIGVRDRWDMGNHYDADRIIVFIAGIDTAVFADDRAVFSLAIAAVVFFIIRR